MSLNPELHGLAGPYALDALDDAERAVFEEHLATCPDCEAEVHSLSLAAAELSHISAAAPPPQLRADVLASISTVRPLAPITDNVIALRRTRVSRSVWQVLAAACAIVAIIAGGWGYEQHSIANKRATAQQTITDRLLAAPDVKAVSGPLGGGEATLLYSKNEKQAVLVGHAVSALPKGKTYQLWIIAGSTTRTTYTSAGTFTPDGDGNVNVTASGDLAGTAAMGVTVEPAGGSHQPSEAPIATMPI